MGARATVRDMTFRVCAGERNRHAERQTMTGGDNGSPQKRSIAMNITPIHPDDVELVASENPTGLVVARRTLGRRPPGSRRTLGARRGGSRRTLGRWTPSRRTLGRWTPSRRTLGRWSPSRRTLGNRLPSRRTFARTR